MFDGKSWPPVATTEDDLRDNDKEGRLYARASTTCMIFPARSWAMKALFADRRAHHAEVCRWVE